MAALVTGGSRGIGSATASRLAELGADIALVQRSPAEATVASIKAHGVRAFVIKADLSEPSAAAAAVEAAADALGGLDGVVCNAGMIVRKPALDLSLAEWNQVLALNLTSVFAISQAAARVFVAQGRPGSIVLMASVLAFQGGLNVSAYAASKGGILQLTRTRQPSRFDAIRSGTKRSLVAFLQGGGLPKPRSRTASATSSGRPRATSMVTRWSWTAAGWAAE